MKEVLDLLRERALKIKLKAPVQFGGAVDVPSVVKFLEAMNESFANYIEAEARNKVKGKHTAAVEKEIKKLKDDARLLFVDLNFASFEASLVPNTVTSPHRFMSVPYSAEFKQETFEAYQNEIIFSDPNSESLLKGLEKKFTADERRAIFSPLYKGVFGPGSLQFYAGRAAEKLQLVEKRPTAEALERLVPEKELAVQEREQHTVVIYAKAEGDPDLFGDKKLKVVKRLAVEELAYETYPYQFHIIGFGGVMIHLTKTYSAMVRFDEETALYHVQFQDLDIHTWGDTRAVAVEAFEFSFTDLVQEFHDAKDAILTPKAKQLRKKLREMVDTKILS